MRSLALIVAGLALASCGGGGGGNDEPPSDPSVWHFRGVNAVADSPVLQFYVDDTAVATSDYGTATDYKPAHTGERPVKVALRKPPDLGTEDPGYQDIGTSETYDFQGPTDYTLVESGTVASPRQFLITDTSRAAVEDNKIEYQVINAAVDAGSTLSFYIKARGAGIDVPQKVDDLALGDYTTKTNLALEAASGADADAARSTEMSFQVRSGNTLLYQSNAITVGEQTRLLIIMADSVGPAGNSPVKLMIFSGAAAAAATVLTNVKDKGELRLANVSPDSGPIDLIVGRDAMDVFAPNIGFGDASAYGALKANTYNAVGTPTGNTGSFLFVATPTVSLGRSYTLYGQGPLVGMRGLFVADDRRVVPTEARFRFFYAAPSLESKAVDIYVVKRGADFDLDATTPPKPRIAGLAYRGISAQQVLDGGSYDAYFTLSADKDIVLGPVPLDLSDGAVQTLALTDNASSALVLVPFNDARE